MRILITGAAGQLGQALQAALGAHEIIALDHRGLDITSLDAVQAALRTARPDAVINAAAYTAVDRAESDVAAAYACNETGARNLAIASSDVGAALLQVSTDYVFDGNATRPYHEGDCPNPMSVYGASKLAGEEAVRAVHPRHFIVRTAWLYHSVGQNFPKTICALAQRGNVRVVNDQHGSPTYAPHLAAAIVDLLRGDSYGTYHLAGSGGASWFELTRELFALLGIRAQVEPVSTAEFPRPAPRPRYSVLETRQQPRLVLPPWQEGLRQFARALT